MKNEIRMKSDKFLKVCNNNFTKNKRKKNKVVNKQIQYSPDDELSILANLHDVEKRENDLFDKLKKQANELCKNVPVYRELPKFENVTVKSTHYYKLYVTFGSKFLFTGTIDVALNIEYKQSIIKRKIKPFKNVRVFVQSNKLWYNLNQKISTRLDKPWMPTVRGQRKITMVIQYNGHSKRKSISKRQKKNWAFHEFSTIVRTAKHQCPIIQQVDDSWSGRAIESTITYTYPLFTIAYRYFALLGR